MLAIIEPSTNNGSDIAPAVITRVWSDEMVNIKVLADSENVLWKTSVHLAADEEAARAKGSRVAYWPPRV